MNQLIFTAFILSVLLGVGHGADLLWGIDPMTGFCAVGSVWWRYLALGIVLLTAMLAGRKTGVQPTTLRSRHVVAGGLAFAGEICSIVSGAATVLSLSGAKDLVQSVLDLMCAAWFFCLGRNWLARQPEDTPTKNLIPAVLGSAVFYWNVLMRFTENSSSWHRVQPTTEVWQQLAAVLFLSVLIRAQYLPQENTHKTLGMTAMAAFVLCLCWQLPQTVYTLLSSPWTTALLAEAFSGLTLCCVGGMAGAFVAEETKKTAEKHGK